MRSRFVLGLISPLAVLVLCAFDGAPALTYNPQHFQNNDPIWDQLNRTTIKADADRGVYEAAFPDELKAKRGQPVQIAGFILPLEASASSAHFSLVRRNTGCPFCPPNAPTEAVEVFARAPVHYTGEEVRMTGRFQLVASSADGLFYRLEDAAVATGR